MNKKERRRISFMIEIDEEDNKLFSKEEIIDITMHAYDNFAPIISFSDNFGNSEWLMNELVLDNDNSKQYKIEIYRKWFFNKYGIIIRQENCNPLDYDFEEWSSDSPSFYPAEFLKDDVVEDLSLIEAYELNKQKIKDIKDGRTRISKYEVLDIVPCFCKLGLKVFSLFTKQLFECVEEKFEEDDIKSFMASLYECEELWSNADLNHEFHLDTENLIANTGQTVHVHQFKVCTFTGLNCAGYYLH